MAAAVLRVTNVFEVFEVFLFFFKISLPVCTLYLEIIISVSGHYSTNSSDVLKSFSNVIRKEAINSSKRLKYDRYHVRVIRTNYALSLMCYVKCLI